ncbi:MAG: hypothetical protein BWX61_01288 [Bacteroidetes bacterium ADurb.Bin035]|nr:MAG: hypothetical protein BWX61_01288 [Bacteroidetes bacterium ADurb.Bin035]
MVFLFNNNLSFELSIDSCLTLIFKYSSKKDVAW